MPSNSISQQSLQNAATDVVSIEEFVNGDNNKIVNSRLGASYDALQKIETDAKVQLNVALTQGLLPLDKRLIDGETKLENQYAEVSTGLFKQLYRKTILFPSVPIGQTQIDMNLAGFSLEKTSVRVEATMNDPATATFVPLPFINAITNIEVNFLLTGTFARVTSTFDYTTSRVLFSVYYAKSTDPTFANPTGIAGPKGDSVEGLFDYFNETEVLIDEAYWQTSASGKKPMYRKIIKIANLPNWPSPNSVLVAHGLNTANIEVGSFRYKAHAFNGAVSFLNLPYVDVSNPAENIELSIDNTNVAITTGFNYNTYSAVVEMTYAKTTDAEI